MRETTGPSHATGRVVIAANPYSGTGENRRHVEALEQALRDRGLEAETVWDLSAAALRGARCIVAAGGDGTLSAVINTMDEPAPVAVLPLGNENLLAGRLGFTKDTEALADAIAAGQTRTIDLGRIDDQRFSIVASAGFDADVAHRLAAWRRRGDALKRVGRLTYLPRILAALLRYRYPMMRLEADGRSVRGALVMAFNLPAYGMDLKLRPAARGDDGLLDWIVFERPGRLRLLGYALCVLLRIHHRRRDVKTGRARRLRISAEQAEAPVEIDGEAAGFTPRTIEVTPGALQVIAMPGKRGSG